MGRRRKAGLPSKSGVYGARANSAHSVELLEARLLLAGVTVITHGGYGSIGWVNAMANAVAVRAGGIEAVSQYVLTIDGLGVVKSLNFESGQHLQQSTHPGEIVIKVDWTAVSGGFSCDDTVPTSIIADLV